METAIAAGDYEPMIVELGEQIAQLSLLQAKALGDYLRETYGLEDAPGGFVVQNFVPNSETVPEVKTTVDVHLSKVGDPMKKIAVVKAVREATGLSLMDSKAVVDKAPSLLKAGLPREDAEILKEKLEKEGATVEFK